MSTRSKAFLKLIVIAVFLYFVVAGKMIDPQAIRVLLYSKWLFIGLAIAFLAELMVTQRWMSLNKGLGVEIRYRRLLGLNFIGHFFAWLLPGALGGDLAKLYCTCSEQNQKKRVILGVALDKFLGIAGTVLVSLAALCVRDHNTALGQQVFSFILIAASLILVSLAILIFFIPRRRNFLQVRETTFKKVLDLFEVLEGKTLVILRALMLSIAALVLLVVLFYFLGTFLGLKNSVEDYFFVVPVGFALSALPLTPGGLGVGQVAFYQLFKLTGASEPQLGATLFTVVQVFYFIFAIGGSIVYASSKKRVPAVRGAVGAS